MQPANHARTQLLPAGGDICSALRPALGFERVRQLWFVFPVVLLFPPGKKSHAWSPVQSVRRSSDGADGAATLILHGLPPFQLSGDSPPDALQVQASIELARAQGDAERRCQEFSVCWRTAEFL